ncbi:hypothetical protein K474DRAFT_705109 [Panus rudis PR-1116 ss-1]|nr:hypothetical protein K474DRAFT_705109 [Panus rudis PR-1116 ss-1]
MSRLSSHVVSLVVVVFRPPLSPFVRPLSLPPLPSLSSLTALTSASLPSLSPHYPHSRLLSSSRLLPLISLCCRHRTSSFRPSSIKDVHSFTGVKINILFHHPVASPFMYFSFRNNINDSELGIHIQEQNTTRTRFNINISVREFTSRHTRGWDAGVYKSPCKRLGSGSLQVAVQEVGFGSLQVAIQEAGIREFTSRHARGWDSRIYKSPCKRLGFKVGCKTSRFFPFFPQVIKASQIKIHQVQHQGRPYIKTSRSCSLSFLSSHPFVRLFVLSVLVLFLSGLFPLLSLWFKTQDSFKTQDFVEGFFSFTSPAQGYAKGFYKIGSRLVYFWFKDSFQFNARFRFRQGPFKVSHQVVSRLVSFKFSKVSSGSLQHLVKARSRFF